MNENEKNKKLLKAPDYREFMRISIEEKKANSWGAYSAISKRAGFSSRTFVRDIVSGKRRVTAKTLSPISNALGLKGYLKNYFELLVFREENDFKPAELTVSKIENKLEKLRDKISKRSVVGSGKLADDLISRKHWVEIYAALGTFELGASIDEIILRTGKNVALIQNTLEEMCLAEIIREDKPSRRYFALSSHVVSQAWNGIHREYFLDSVRAVAVRAKTSFTSPDRLYWKSVFSMQSGNAAQFKTELRELILKFVDSAEDPNGNTLGHITIAFESQI